MPAPELLPARQQGAAHGGTLASIGVQRRAGPTAATMQRPPDDTVPKLFAPHAPMPKGHGYGNTHRNAAEAKWRANQQDKQQRAVAKQLGLQLPEDSPKIEDNPRKRGLSAEPEPPPVPEDSDEQRRTRAWSAYYAAMALEEGRTPEERMQAEAWAKYYAEQITAGAAAAVAAAGAAGAAGAEGGGSRFWGAGEQHGVCREAGEAPAAPVGLTSSERKRAKAAASASPLKLLTAVRDGNAQATRQQLAHGVSVDTADDEGTPVVVLASKLNHPAVLKVLRPLSSTRRHGTAPLTRATPPTPPCYSPLLHPLTRSCSPPRARWTSRTRPGSLRSTTRASRAAGSSSRSSSTTAPTR